MNPDPYLRHREGDPFWVDIWLEVTTNERARVPNDEPLVPTDRPEQGPLEHSTTGCAL